MDDNKIKALYARLDENKDGKASDEDVIKICKELKLPITPVSNYRLIISFTPSS